MLSYWHDHQGISTWTISYTNMMVEEWKLQGHELFTMVNFTTQKWDMAHGQKRVFG